VVTAVPTKRDRTRVALDIYRRRLSRQEIPRVVAHLVRVLGVDAERITVLGGARQRFAPWRPLPLSPLD